MTYRHLFFDMDLTIAPPRQPVLDEMYELLSTLTQDITVVSGSHVDQMRWQTRGLQIHKLGQNGNHAVDVQENELWYTPLEDHHRQEILEHIDALTAHLDELPNENWNPIEDRGGQITFSPIGNTAPVEHKRHYDPDRTKRNRLLQTVPFNSKELMVKIGGSTSLDYLHKERHKGTNVRRFIDHHGWDPAQCVYIGDGLYPGGNDELVIGVIDTVPVTDHLDTYRRLREMFA